MEEEEKWTEMTVRRLRTADHPKEEEKEAAVHVFHLTVGPLSTSSRSPPDSGRSNAHEEEILCLQIISEPEEDYEPSDGKTLTDDRRLIFIFLMT